MATSTERDVAEFVEACDRGLDEASMFAETSRRLRKLVPFDGAAWFATDPATVLAVNPVRIENVEDGHCSTYWGRECNVEDTMLFRDLARSERNVQTLYDATGSNPVRSTRYREFLQPQGYRDELRAALRVGESTWGVIDLFRERHRPVFTAAEVALVRALAPTMATALRTLAGVRAAAPAVSAAGPGTALFDASGTLLSLDEAAEQLFEEVAGPTWATHPLPMTPIYATVARAAAVRAGRDRGPAAVRVRALSGRWIAVHASCLRGADDRPAPTALTIEPAKSAQIAPIIVEAYRLTPREQEITRAVARGLSNAEIAADLFLSPHTVRDHLKAIFGKIGVTSRGELVAKLFADHYGPAVHTAGYLEHVQVG
ncbi:GAF domain-containing protein [Nakamurella panacisegetis]|uniref:GAF domain-containing protein n=1 Tax=Nakamurella panacisegetis TaxID=1090615 RepID=A0A1H0LNB3_9ACTN|nr:LuxR C-terminal-related transcriptional regulator [Nakamurella panacisegetis]SDO69634.1 GAF domain-containing protein [Nakamurella panacisegetis]